MENRICVVCGNGFKSKTMRAKYCSEYCKNRSRYSRSLNAYHSETARAKERVIALYSSDLSCEEIADKCGRSKTFVYGAWREAGLEAKQRLTDLQRTVKTLREQGMCCVEIAEQLGKPAKTILQTAIAIGMPFTEAEKEKSIQIGRTKQAQTLVDKYGDDARRRRVSELHPGWTWVSGSIGTSDMVKIRCDCCQNVIERSAITIRHRSEIVCPSCAEAERQRQQEKKEQERLRKEREREERFWSQDFTQSALSFRICVYCGAPHLRTNAKCCSEECSRKYVNSKGDRRVRRMRKADKSISLKKLYLRDGGKCWICGDKCDFNDCRHDENGNFIVGLTYPSIDHVYPISKGGVHSWDNVKLAHHYCNTLKNDKVVV